MANDNQTYSEQHKSLKSEMIKSGKRTYFLDILKSAKGDKYLKITETRFIDDKQPRQRNSIIIFNQDLENFKKSLNNLFDFIATN